MKTRGAMNTWMTVLALTAAGTMLATPGFAQTGSGSSPSTTGADTKSGTAPAARPSNDPGVSRPSTGTAGSDTTKSGATGTDMKSGAMGSDTKSGAKGGDMKSDAMKSRPPGRSARGAGSTEQVKAVQQALKDKGHDAGDIDGKMGPKTQAALRDFQQQEGLKATGRADADTMAKLGGSSSSDTGASKDATSTGAKQTK